MENVINAASFNHINFGGFVWINIDTPEASILHELQSLYRFHHLDIEDCLSKIQLPKMDEYPEYLFIILHLPRFKKDRQYSVPKQVAIFLSKEFLVTVHSGEIKPINRLFRSFASLGEGDAAQTISSENGVCNSPARLLYRMLKNVLENLIVMLGKVISNIENIEEKVFDEKSDAVREVTELRHDIANLRRIVFPLRRVIHDLEKKIQIFSTEDMSIYFSDLSDSIEKAWTILEECKETIEIYKDSDYTISSDRTNKILTLLTIMFTFSIPFTVLGSLYGMNVHLPGGLERPWTFLGPYTTFILILLASSVPVGLMYIFFRRMRWI
jgi:magnesium transporter